MRFFFLKNLSISFCYKVIKEIVIIISKRTNKLYKKFNNYLIIKYKEKIKLSKSNNKNRNQMICRMQNKNCIFKVNKLKEI